jgi:hypothetical protein
MKRRGVFWIVGFLALVALSLLFAHLVVAGRGPTSAFTVRHVKTIQVDGRLIATFTISNHTDKAYAFGADSLEVFSGSGWTDFCHIHRRFDGLAEAHGGDSDQIDMTNPPTGTPLRLKLWGAREMKGAASFLFRLKHKLRGRPVSLNPSAGRIFADRRIVIVSDEFVEPERKSEPDVSR